MDQHQTKDSLLAKMNLQAKNLCLTPLNIEDRDKVDEHDYVSLDDTCPSESFDLPYPSMSAFQQEGAGDYLPTRCPKKSDPPSLPFKSKPDVYERLSQPKGSPRSRVHPECSRYDSPDGNQGKQSPPKGLQSPLQINNPDPYEEYLRSDTFAIDSPISVIRKCLELSNHSTSESVRAFWLTHQSQLLALIRDHHIVALKMLIPEIKYHIKNAASFMSGVIAGQSIAKTNQAEELISSLGSMIDSLKVSHKKAREESVVHQKQTLEFINQINNASESVAGFQRSVERVKLAALKLDIAPAPVKASEVLQELPSIGDISTPSSYLEPVGQIVEKIMDSGTYTTEKATVKVGDQNILSFDSKAPELKALSVIVGRPKSFGLPILNRSLEQLSIKSAQDIDWLRKLIPKPPSVDKSLLIKTLQSIPIKKYQWLRKDIETD